MPGVANSGIHIVLLGNSAGIVAGAFVYKLYAVFCPARRQLARRAAAAATDGRGDRVEDVTRRLSAPTQLASRK